MTRRHLSDDQRDLVESVWATYRPFVESVARRHLNGQVDHLPDVVQAVGLIVCRSWHTFRAAGGLRTWIFRVTVNEVRQIQRKETRHRRILDALTFDPPRSYQATPHDILEQRRTVAAVQEALAELKPRNAEILRHDLDGSGIYTSEAGRSQRYRARKELRRLFDRTHEKDDDARRHAGRDR